MTIKPKQVAIILIATINWVTDSTSTTSQACNSFDDGENSKLEIQCFNYKNFLRFNVSLNENIDTIKLIRNSIKALDSSSFPNRSEAIERLFLNSNQIKNIFPGSFKNFPNLQVLDLTDNNISELHADTFVGNKHLREIYLDGNNFEVLKLETFRSLTELEKVTLEENQLDGCKPETAQTLDYFKENGVVTEPPDYLCNIQDIQIVEDSLDLRNFPESKVVTRVLSTEVTTSSGNKTSESFKEFMFDTLHLNKNHFYFSVAFIITVIVSAVGFLSFICIIRRHRKRNNRRTRLDSEKSLIGEEEGYLTPIKTNSCPTYVEVLSELEKTCTNSGHFQNNFVDSIGSTSRLQPKIHKINHIYEEIKLPQENLYGKIWKD